MTTLGLLRHGEVEGGVCFRGHQDDPLSATGFSQMWHAVKATEWDSIVTSPLKRCADFAQQMAQQQNIPLEINSDLMEIYFGKWEGKTAAEIMEDTPELLANFWQDPRRYSPPEAETLPKFEARILRVRNAILRQFGEQRILLVTHGGVIRVMLCQTRQIPTTNLFDIDVPHGSLHIST